MGGYNVVLLTIDCLRYDRCGFNGKKPSPTPFLDSLAEKSTVWSKAYSTGPMTPESVPGILAGLHSHNSAQMNDDIALKSIPDNQPTIASWLSDLGYKTYAILSNTHLTSRRNYGIGFDVFWNPLETDIESANPMQSGRSRFQKSITHCRKQMRSNSNLLSPYSVGYLLYRFYQSRNSWPTPNAEHVLEKTQSAIDDASSPFFIWSHFMDVHGPYHPNTFCDLQTYKGMIADCGRASGNHTKWLDDAYNSTISYVDIHINKIVDMLKAAEQWENTILVVTADHGEALFDRGWIGHTARHYLFDELTHVPLLVRYPNRKARRSDNPISLAWLNEIIAEAIDEDAPDFPSTSNQPSLIENEDRGQVPLADGLDEQGHSVAAISHSGKYIAHSSGETNEIRSPVWHENSTYYHLLSDPDEQKPLSGECSDEKTTAAARQELTSKRQLPSLANPLSDSARERLQDIGYLV